MFRHAKTEERQGGIKWRLDLGILEKYLIQKGYMDRFQRLGLENRVSELKGEIINKTILVLGDSTEGTIDEKYNLLAEIWG